MARAYTLITGASQGIGLALAEELARTGAPLILVARRAAVLKAEAQRLQRLYHVPVQAVALDLSQPQAALQLCQRLRQCRWAVDTLVNNAGFGVFGAFADQPLPVVLNMLQLNILTLTDLTHRLLPQLRQRRGRILNVASTAAFQPGPYLAAYYASKAYVLHFSEALANELAGEVTVTALCPGPTATGFAQRAGRGTQKLFKRVGTAAVTRVARAAIVGLQRGQRVVVPGWKNQLLLLLVRLLPRRTVTAIIGHLSRPR